MRSFPIRNRNVHEIAGVIRTLLDAGILQAGAFEPGLEPGRSSELRV